MSRALFVIGGFGLGNSTRCCALIERLHSQGISVDVATSSNGLWFFSDSIHVNNLVSLEALSYRSGKNGISFFRTLIDLPRLFWNLISNAIKIVRLQRRNNYSFIATDSEYSAFLARIFLFVPLVSINNVFFTFSGSLGRLSKERRWRVLPALIVEYLDFLLQSNLSDFRIAPVLEMNKNLGSPGTLYCPPLVRRGFQEFIPPKNLSRALVVASGSGLGVSKKTVDSLAKCDSIQEIRVVGLEGVSQGKVTYLGRQKDISSYVGDSDFIVSNGGFSTISEALVSSRPILLIPIENHYEQIQNARFVEALGLGVVTKDEWIEKDLLRLSSFSRVDDRSVNPPLNGAELAANALKSLGLQNEFSFSPR